MEFIGGLFGFLVFFWLAGAFFSSFYFWTKRTDRSMAPIERRFRASFMGLAWPYFAYVHFSSKDSRAADSAEFDAQRARILGNAPGAVDSPPAAPSAGTSAPRMTNPFDNR